MLKPLPRILKRACSGNLTFCPTRVDRFVLDIETVKESLKEIIYGGRYAAEAEYILQDELFAVGFHTEDILTVIAFAKTHYSSPSREWYIDSYAERLSQDPFSFLIKIKEYPAAARALVRHRPAVIQGF